ncbi:MAG TPA: AAA family ATPase [Methanospirillum sp.]|uniref:ParA family protein n=1 Tax=Methanospirillum sp. TaxID=45200 RepID=UPI002CD48068|nr:AAA family ATPase [Methanospirillum sp.]HOJ96368.1 AAA family ATPase [Methanospirillum sp.]HPP77096.1 AAA family ATPase [Methanospirillum sp.]
MHHKGGTGKTTSCLQIAGILKNLGRRVLIIDTDPQANATLGLGVYPESLQKHIYHYYIQQSTSPQSSPPLSDFIIKTISGIDIVPSHLDLVGAEAVLYQNPNRYHILKNGIQQIKNRYDHILIDTPPFLGQFLMNGMIAADYSVMVFSSDIFAIAGYDNITLVIRDIKEILGINIHIGMAILNRWNNPSEKKETLLEKIQHLFGLKPEDKPGSLQEIRNELEKRIQTEIPEIVIIAEGKEVSQSIKKGIPLITMAPDDPAMPGFTRAASIIDSWRIGGR